MSNPPHEPITAWEQLEKEGYTLPQEEFDRCVQEQPTAGMKFTPDRLSNAQLRECIRQSPQLALCYIADKMTRTEFNRAREEYQVLAAIIAPARISQKKLIATARKNPTALIDSLMGPAGGALTNRLFSIRKHLPNNVQIGVDKALASRI